MTKKIKITMQIMSCVIGLLLVAAFNSQAIFSKTAYAATLTDCENGEHNFCDENGVYQINCVSCGAVNSQKCGENAYYVYDNNTNTLYVYGEGEIRQGAFSGKDSNIDKSINSNVNKIIISNGISRIGTQTFDNCQQLASIEFPTTVTWLGENPFGYVWEANERVVKKITIIDHGIDIKKESSFGVIYKYYKEKLEEAGCIYINQHEHNLNKIEKIESTCQMYGHKEYYTCKICNKIYEDLECKNEIQDIDAWLVTDGRIALAGHINMYENNWFEDDVNHWKVCGVCRNYYDIEEHTGGTATCNQRATCDICKLEYGAYKEHEYSEEWESLDEGHYHICIKCSAILNIEAHIDIDDNKICDVCKYDLHTIKEMTHVREINPTCTSYGVKEYYICSCGKYYSEEYDYDSEITDIEAWKVDEGRIEKLEHSYLSGIYSWERSDKGHYHTCIICTNISDIEEHVDIDNNKVCDVCKYDLHTIKKMTRVIGKEPTCTSYGVKDYYICSCGKYYPKEYDYDNEITDIEAWKVGEGRIEKFEHYIKMYANETEHWYQCVFCKFKKDVSKHKLQTTIIKATPELDGKIDTTCSVCDKQLKNETIRAVDKITLSKSEYAYDGKVKKPALVVMDRDNKIVNKANYDITYPIGMKKVGIYTIKITFKGDKYTGAKNLSYVINPTKTSIKKLVKKKNTVELKWVKKTKEVTGYEIQYSKYSDFNRGIKKVTIKSTKKDTYTIKKLKKGKYFIRIRTYKTIGKKKYYSAWSKSKSVIIK